MQLSIFPVVVLVQEALWALWDAAFPQEPLLVSGQWGSMGWLREDPSTDLR